MTQFTAMETGNRRFSRKAATVILAFSWFFGLLCGIVLFHNSEASSFLLMRRCVHTSVSIVTLLCVSIFPFLLSALAVFLSSPWLVFFICFGKAFAFAFVLSGMEFTWGSIAWIMRFPVLFCDMTLLPLFYFLCRRFFSGREGRGFQRLLFPALPGIIAAIALSRLVIPFFAEMIL